MQKSRVRMTTVSVEAKKTIAKSLMETILGETVFPAEMCGFTCYCFKWNWMTKKRNEFI